jgi:hypothetical protein
MTCHPDPLYTGLLTYNVLKTSNPADKHGLTSRRTVQDLAGLAGFLLVLPYGP